ncbi:hypothetical protein ACFL5M_07180 [Candidatus Neomarinimicrobiota bacterium]
MTTTIAEKPGIQRVSFYTLGCKLNQAETDGIATLFRQRKYRVVPFKEEADLTFINTCTNHPAISAGLTRRPYRGGGLLFPGAVR